MRMPRELARTTVLGEVTPTLFAQRKVLKMARYAPLPSVNIDPRNEAEIVQAAAQRVYEASVQTLNDFSAGSPLMALLE